MPSLQVHEVGFALVQQNSSQATGQPAVLEKSVETKALQVLLQHGGSANVADLAACRDLLVAIIEHLRRGPTSNTGQVATCRYDHIRLTQYGALAFTYKH
jgi:hypothetical protein